MYRRLAYLSFVLCLLAALLAVGGCAAQPKNAELRTINKDYGYRFRSQDVGDTFVVLAFSGGTRAAALAQGVLREMQNTVIGPRKTLLDEVDLVSSVSGGSVTAANFALKGPTGLQRIRGELPQEKIHTVSGHRPSTQLRGPDEL